MTASPEEPLPASQPTGMRGFVVVWIGQILSLLGTNMTNFALTIWAFEETGQATALALVGFFFITPFLIVSPIAGALVDRSNRKLVMMISDLVSGLTTIALLLLYWLGSLEIWHLYVTAAISGTFQTFQWPAYSAAITTMVPKEQYGRANGMMSLAETGSGIFAPLLAGALLAFVGLQGILLIDVITFTFAIIALLLVHVPQPPITEAGQKGKGSIWRESLYGFQYIIERPSLLGLQLVFLLANFFAGLGFAVFAPMILARTGSNEIIFGTVQSAGAVGGVIGGAVMSTWGGPKRRVHGVLLGWILASLPGQILVGLGQTMPVWVAGVFLGAFFGPIINGSNQAIWQAKVAPDVQGRVFSARRLIAWSMNPLTLLVAGPLADRVLEPAMQPGGSLASTFGALVGTGPGAGMALIMVITGIGATAIGALGYLFSDIRDAESLLPDHDMPDAAAGNQGKEGNEGS